MMGRNLFLKSDFIRAGIIVLLIAAAYTPYSLSQKEEKNKEVFLAKAEKIQERLDAEMADWNRKSPQEKFIWCITDIDKRNYGVILEVNWEREERIIYICCASDKKKGDDFEAEKEYRDSFGRFASESNVPDKIYLVGLNAFKEVVWTIDDEGRVF